MKPIAGSPGEHIAKAAERAIAMAPVDLEFNDVVMSVYRDDTPSTVERRYSDICNERAVAYRNSAEGIASAKRREDEVQAAQDLLNRKVADLASLDWFSDVDVLDWILSIQDATDRSGVDKRAKEIVATFAHHGFEPNVNCGEAYKDGDRDNEFRYLVGQALATLQTVSIHPIVHTFAERWKAKFLVQPKTST